MATTSLCATSRPQTRPIGYQSWHDLLFLHWSVPGESLAGRLPPGLTLDTWQGRAWIGLVAFRMTGIRPWWFPPVWHLSAFPETNVRTYVRCGDHEPGVWFFSLDAARLLPVFIAQRKWHLNYHWARMRVTRKAQCAAYTSRRFGRHAAHARIEAEVEEPTSIPHCAEADTLEHFLIERYAFYNQAPDGRLLQGRVRHSAYPLQPARLVTLDESLVAANGLDVSGPPSHVIFSPGVNVEIVSLQEVGVHPLP